MIDLTNIPVIYKTPVRGLALQQLFVEAGLASPIFVPNGALVGILATYTPGQYYDLGTFVRLHDVILNPYGTVCVSVWGGKTDSFYAVDVLSENMSSIAQYVRGTWDFIAIIFDLRRAPVPPVSLVDEISGIRAAVIAVNALIID